MAKDDNQFMRQAIKLAKLACDNDEVPVGAVIVYESKVIAKGYNQIECLCDPTAHAEILAITSASQYLKSKWLYGCTLYVTLEPCAMCAGALVLSRIDKVVFGASDPKTGAFGSKVNMNKLKLNHKIKIKQGVLQQECTTMLQQFFSNKRKEKKIAKNVIC
jgi:tRNA(adenine34) deaminase